MVVDSASALPALGAEEVRLIGAAVVGLMAAGFLYLVVFVEDPLADDSGEDDDSESELYSPGPAYGAGSETDPTEVLQVDEEE